MFIYTPAPFLPVSGAIGDNVLEALILDVFSEKKLLFLAHSLYLKQAGERPRQIGLPDNDSPSPPIPAQGKKTWKTRCKKFLVLAVTGT